VHQLRINPGASEHADPAPSITKYRKNPVHGMHGGLLAIRCDYSQPIRSDTICLIGGIIPRSFGKSRLIGQFRGGRHAAQSAPISAGTAGNKSHHRIFSQSVFLGNPHHARKLHRRSRAELRTRTKLSDRSPLPRVRFAKPASKLEPP
jgi:hypothetical protein